MDFLLPFLVVLCIFLIIIALLLFLKTASLQNEISELRFRKASQSVKYGKISEQFIPFIKKFPFLPDTFRFLGNPIDGIAFGDDEIVFCEFKASASQLSQKQRKIRDLVKNKKVSWLEFRLDSEP
jgi:predicted Holliday junction resolvase-like endonuclease